MVKIDPTLFEAQLKETRPVERPRADFGAVMEDALRAVDDAHQAADRAVVAGAKGEVDFHDVALAMEEADLSMRVMVKVRNKIVEAYQEIMRMPV